MIVTGIVSLATDDKEAPTGGKADLPPWGVVLFLIFWCLGLAFFVWLFISRRRRHAKYTEDET